MNNYKKWLSPVDLEALLDISKSTQAKMRMQRKIPYLKFGKFIKYDHEDIDKWLVEHKIVKSL